MNGGVNGTMEDLKELSQKDSPEHIVDDNEETSLETKHCESSQLEPYDHAANNTDGLENNDIVLAEDTNSYSIADHEPDKCLIETDVQQHEDVCNNTLEKHCSDRNESHTDSLNIQLNSECPLEEPMGSLLEIDNSKEHRIHSNNGISDEVESENESSEDDSSETSLEPRAEETVSINSESETEVQDDSSQESELRLQNSDVVLSQNDRSETLNGSLNDCSSSEVHEIPSDNEDCVIAEAQKPVVDNKVTQLRRSSRTIKRKRYDDEIGNGDRESDLEDLVLDDCYKRKTKPIFINDTKALVEMVSKQMKSGIQKKEPTVVIIDTNSTGKGHSVKRNNMSSISSSLAAQSLYQSIVARGTTVTPVSSKNNNLSSQSNSSSQPLILPSLTDDMFVVEAPSFIVPYVYEKPSIKPFREFVNNLGNDLKEQRAKEEKELKDKEKEETAKDKVKQEKTESDELEESEEEHEDVGKKENVVEEKSKKKNEDKRDRRRIGNDDDASWDGESSTDTEEEIGSDEEDKTVVIKDKADVIDDIKDVTGLTVEKVVTGKSDNYFDLSLGKFFMNIGLNLVQEFVQNDLLKQQNRKLYREKKAGHSTKITESSIVSLTKNLEFSKENNAPYRFKQHKCEFCSFKSESLLVMAHHLETPHMKNSVYKCNFCSYESRSPHDILYHLEAEHNTRGKLERAPSNHQCANCPFEDNGKGKLARHIISCTKKFKPEFNLSPPIEWEPPAKIPKIGRARNPMMGSYTSSFHRGQVGNNIGRPPIGNVMTSSGYRPRGRTPMSIPPRSTPVQGIPILRSGIMVRHASASGANFPNNGKNLSLSKSLHQPSISITPLPRQPQPQQQPQPSQQNKNTCVICEICDGYIKDLEQLRNHMQWIHKVKIHPKMIYNRPPLNCQKCQFRFFTDQGLERHLLGSHGLVTSSMQEAANKGKDAGRCPVCGRVYQWKLLNHVARDHHLTLKPAHLSYKCTVCTATFGMYKQFENHVYSAHSVVAKRVMDKGKPAPSTKAGQSLLKPLKINDEITIIPQPVKPITPPSKEK
ncbi:uncharacterized protein LOC116777198 [Danaus plexippus]|uniref:uncharacterized protein LOC116777198 n=1 Tax=Danaus plexippus TaxID=13037 RepID=UPI002AAF3A55|nr:uncharacterized protein LOC116777198 [Danaus plexippus]